MSVNLVRPFHYFSLNVTCTWTLKGLILHKYWYSCY